MEGKRNPSRSKPGFIFRAFGACAASKSSIALRVSTTKKYPDSYILIIMHIKYCKEVGLNLMVLIFKHE
mgnify:CR=1 FL=1|jgi:hypothetical protein